MADTKLNIDLKRIIKFVSFKDEFVKIMNDNGYESYRMDIKDYEASRTNNPFIYYVSPANSFGYMDGGIDLPLSREIFPGVEPYLVKFIQEHGIITSNRNHRKYNPIGSSIIVEGDMVEQNWGRKALVSSPTMIVPSVIKNTRNAYYATMATLYNILINRGLKPQELNEIEILFTDMGGGCGRMPPKQSSQQILDAIRDFPQYKPTIISKYYIQCAKPSA